MCDAWAKREPNRIALIEHLSAGRQKTTNYGELCARSNALANGLRELGVGPGDRVALLAPQGLDVLTGHIAIYKLGAIAVPLALLFGREALGFRLRFAGVKAVIANTKGAANIDLIDGDLPDLQWLIETEPNDVAAKKSGFRRIALAEVLAGQPTNFEPVDTGPDDPALMIFTSGTTGAPKGALHGHRVLLGHLPGVEMPQDLFPQPGDLFWTPADWAWIGGLLDVLLPSLHHGVPVLAKRLRKFEPDAAYALMARHKVRNVFFPPTALKLMRGAPVPAGHGAALRSIGSGGETLGEELLDWGRSTFGVTINEFYGQTECNLVVANCSPLYPVRAGFMGRAAAGHRVAIIDDDGNELPDGETGEIAVRRPDPVMFLGYWNNERATQEKFNGDWLKTGDRGRRDAQGYFKYVGRADDVITSAGYRIGPAEIEDCLIRHPAVAMAAVIGVPDPIRTEAIKAFIVAKPGITPG
ncbi:MAG: AMP-binding protein, partial [Proteobacteria bacterium]|nr:AMP-binding protein [Pseudomonadota bacterium]